jgi:hypothetical protein
LADESFGSFGFIATLAHTWVQPQRRQLFNQTLKTKLFIRSHAACGECFALKKA